MCVLGLFGNISIESTIFSFGPSSGASILVIDGCSFTNITNSGLNGTVIHMTAGGSVELQNSVFSNINTSHDDVLAGVIHIIGTATSSFLFENNKFSNIISDRSAVLLTGISNGVSILNSSFNIISSNSSGGVFIIIILLYIIMYLKGHFI
jgi:hypothetical protein